MNDALYEQLVPRKQKTSGILISILIIVLAVAVAVLGMPLVGFLSFLIAVLILMIAFYFIFPKLNVEYEYMILNHDLQIDAIYNIIDKPRRFVTVSYTHLTLPTILRG